MFGLGPFEIAIILAIVIVLFGARRLPELGAATGKALRNLKAGLSGEAAEPDPDEPPKRDDDEPGPR